MLEGFFVPVGVGFLTCQLLGRELNVHVSGGAGLRSADVTDRLATTSSEELRAVGKWHQVRVTWMLERLRMIVV